MRIDRQSTRPLFARKRQRGGCFSFIFALGIVALIGVFSREWLLQFLAINQSLSPDSLSTAQRYYDEGDLNTAIIIARRLLDADPYSVETATLLVRALIYRSYVDHGNEFDRVAALNITRNLYQTRRSDPDVLALHALAVQVNGDPEEASRLALRAIEQKPDSMPARIALSLAYASRGIFQASLREADFAVTVASNQQPGWQMDAHRVRAIALSDLGRYQDAITAAETAISHHRRMIPVHFERALYALQVGNTNAATASYFQVIAIDNDNAKAYLRLCEMSSSLREREAAVNYCEEALARAPVWSDVWYTLGREYFLQGDMRGARDALGKCSSLQVLQNVPIPERTFECWYLQGQAAEMLGDCETLVPLYQEFQDMVDRSDITQTWTYPPEGPPMCASIS